MKKTLFILLAIFSSHVFSQQGQKNFIDQNYIEVTGKAELEIVPNEIYVRIFISENDNKGKKTVEVQEKKMKRALQKIGIDIAKDLSVEDMSSNLKKYWLKKDKIRSSKAYQLLVYDAKTLGRVFQELEAIGISNINITRVDHSEKEGYKSKVKVMAIKAAKVKAKLLADAIDENLGKALYIQEIQIYNNYRHRNLGANVVLKESADFNENLPEIEFEKIKMEASVLTRFALQ